MNEIHQNFDRLDLNLLRLFEVIYRERSLSRAADILHLTPSAISHALRRMRLQFDDPLFERAGHRMVPTPFCDQIAPDIIGQMGILRDMAHRWARFDPSESTAPITLALPDALEILLLPALRARLAQEAPGAQLTTMPVTRRSLVMDLQRGRPDLAMDVKASLGSVLRRVPLMRSGWCAVTAPRHPFAQAPSRDAYERGRHIAVSSRAFGAVLEDPMMADSGITRQIALRCQNYLSALNTVQGSDLILTMPRSLAQQLAQGRDGLQLSALPMGLPEFELFLYWHEDFEGDKRNIWLRETLCQLLPIEAEAGAPGAP